MTKRLLVVAGIVLLVLASLAVAFRAWFPAERVRALIATEGSRRLGAEVRVGGIHPSLFPLGMRVDSLSVANPAGGNAPPLLSLGEGSLKVRFAPLFSRRIEVASAQLDRVALVMILGPDGKLILPRPAGAGTPATSGDSATEAQRGRRAPFAFLLSSLDISGGSFRMIDPAHGREIAFDDVNAHSGMEFIPGSTAIHLRGEGRAAALRTTDLTAAGLAEGLRDLSLAWDLALKPAEGALEITSARAGSGEVGVNVTGGVTGLNTAPAVDLTIPAQTFDLTRLLPLVSPMKRPDGTTLEITGSGTVGIEGGVHMPAEGAPRHRIVVSARDVAVKSSAAPDAEVTHLTGELESRPGEADIRRLAYDIMDRHVEMGGLLRVAPDSITTENFHLATGRTRVSVTGKVSQPTGAKNVVFEARSPYIDLAEFMPPQPATSGAASPDGAGATGAVATVRPLLPPLPIGSARGVVSVDTLVAPGVNIRNARGNVLLDAKGLDAALTADRADVDRLPFTGIRGQVVVTPDGTVKVNSASARLFSGNVGGDVEMHIRGPNDVDYRVNAKATDLEANDFLTALTPARNLLFGQMGMTIDFAGRGLTPEVLARSITATGDATVLAGRFVNLPMIKRVATVAHVQELQDQIDFRDLASHFEVKDGRVHTRDLKVESGQASWQADGSVGFDGTLDYALTLTLSKELTASYTRRAPLAGLFMTPDQRMIFDLKVSGPGRDPKVSLDAAKTASRNGIRNAQDVIGKITQSREAQDLLDRLKKQIPGRR